MRRIKAIENRKPTRCWQRIGRLIGAACLGTLLTAAVPGQVFAKSLIIRGATIFDATGRKPFVGDVRIDDARITAMGTDLGGANEATVIDAVGLSLLPGLIDIHLHWTAQNESQERLETAHTLVLSGVTTATDFHSAPESYAPKRRWEQLHTTPHTAYAARMSTPGGHGADWADANMTRTVTSAHEARVAAERLRSYEPDLIKVFSDGWRYGSGINHSSINENALTVIVEEAGKTNTPVFTHTVTVAKAKIAARAKVSAIVHAVQDENTDKELVSLLKDNGIYYAPTLAVYEPRADKLTNATEEDLQRVRKRQAHSKYNLRRFHKAGVKIALGTDSGIASTPYGESSLRELELLVEFGLDPKSALIAGTANSAAALRLSSDRGTIAIGQRADLVLVKGSPWRRISDYRNIEYVFIDGRVVARGGEVITKADYRAAPARITEKVVDDFERADGRTRAGALRLQNADSRHPRSTVISQIVPRGSDGHALHMSASMAVKEEPNGRVVLPLSIGGFSVVDVTAYDGLRFDIRGEGSYMVGLLGMAGAQRKDLVADDEWRTVSIRFDEFPPNDADRPADDARLYSIEFGAQRLGGESFWMEIDNVEFFP